MLFFRHKLQKMIENSSDNNNQLKKIDYKSKPQKYQNIQKKFLETYKF